MAKEVCVFCGEEVGYIRSEWVPCGPTEQLACKNCAKEIKELSVEERCRQALRHGLASSREKLEEFVAMAEGAEDLRPKCPTCGGKLSFGKTVALEAKFDLMNPLFHILPARCGDCGKLELYDPDLIARNKTLAYLVEKDTGKPD